MRPLDFAIVGLRLFGIYFIAESVPLLGESILIYANAKFSHPTIPSLTPVWSFSLCIGILQMILGILLLIFSRLWAQKLVPPAAEEAKKAACTFEEVQTIAFAVTGLLIIALALPGLGWALQSLYDWIYYQRHGGVPPSPYLHSDLHALGVIAQLAFGFLLFLNPRGFRNAWHWLRTAGTQPTNPVQ